MCFTKKQYESFLKTHAGLQEVLEKIPPLFTPYNGDEDSRSSLAETSLCVLAGQKFCYGPQDFKHETFLEVLKDWIYCWPSRGEPEDMTIDEANQLWIEVMKIVEKV